MLLIVAAVILIPYIVARRRRILAGKGLSHSAVARHWYSGLGMSVLAVLGTLFAGWLIGVLLMLAPGGGDSLGAILFTGGVALGIGVLLIAVLVANRLMLHLVRKKRR